MLGPAGLAYDAERQVLYVASTADNKIFAVKHPITSGTRTTTGSVIYDDAVHLRGPLGLAFAPNGDLLVANGDAITPTGSNGVNSGIVEFTPTGHFVSEISIDPRPAGAFGLAVSSAEDEITFASVNDNTNMLEGWSVNEDKHEHEH